MKTWKIIEWIDKPDREESVTLICPCGHDAECSCSPHPDFLISAVVGMQLFLDPPDADVPKNFLPNSIQCRQCGRIFSDKENICTENSSHQPLPDQCSGRDQTCLVSGHTLSPTPLKDA